LCSTFGMSIYRPAPFPDIAGSPSHPSSEIGICCERILLKSPPHCLLCFLLHIFVSIGLKIDETGESLGSAFVYLMKFLIGHCVSPFVDWNAKMGKAPLEGTFPFRIANVWNSGYGFSVARKNELLSQQMFDHCRSITFGQELCHGAELRQTLFIQLGTGSANFSV